MTHNPHPSANSLHLPNVSMSSIGDFSEPIKESVHETLCDLGKSQAVQDASISVAVVDENSCAWEKDQKVHFETEIVQEEPKSQVKSTGSLWGHKDLHTKSSRTRIILLIVMVFIGYGVALFVNGVASRFVRPRFFITPIAKGGDPLARLGMVNHVFDPVYLIALFRTIAAVFLLSFMAFRKDTPWDSAATAKQYDDYRSKKVVVDGVLLNPFVLTPKVLIPFAIGACNAGGYMFFMSLTSRSGSATWSAMAGLYIVFPCIYGIFFKGEARTLRKILGIIFCIVASALLSLGKQQEVLEDDSTTVPWVQTAILFLMAIVCWGACDGMAAYIGRSLHTFYVVLFTGLGFLSISFLSSLASFIVVSMYPVENEYVPPSEDTDNSSGSGSDSALMGPTVGYILIFVAQLGGVAAWYGSVLLGKLSEASAFLPITSLYTILSSLLSVLILGESLSALGWSGIALAVIGMLAIATS